ncbi:hypothetical protein BJ508DRAFT_373766 [Ascobolus immersus RN42]|uniref:Uncharacterized protein n=1 Tax=Ascobolus immersus RN42 TaxID=1160509 RepID=A0A3N4IGX9_ASCIM|nr:hypothetical protein BJ508DRAFT_373766 [Ascobolus immersus RN42]
MYSAAVWKSSLIHIHYTSHSYGAGLSNSSTQRTPNNHIRTARHNHGPAFSPGNKLILPPHFHSKLQANLQDHRPQTLATPQSPRPTQPHAQRILLAAPNLHRLTTLMCMAYTPFINELRHRLLSSSQTPKAGFVGLTVLEIIEDRVITPSIQDVTKVVRYKYNRTYRPLPLSTDETQRLRKAIFAIMTMTEHLYSMPMDDDRKIVPNSTGEFVLRDKWCHAPKWTPVIDVTKLLETWTVEQHMHVVAAFDLIMFLGINTYEYRSQLISILWDRLLNYKKIKGERIKDVAVSTARVVTWSIWDVEQESLAEFIQGLLRRCGWEGGLDMRRYGLVEVQPSFDEPTAFDRKGPVLVPDLWMYDDPLDWGTHEDALLRP